jgi:orotidine-5'-phosphate decarboxylase
MLVDELLIKRARNKLIVDLRHCKTLRDARIFINELSSSAGYFCLSSSILASNSLIAAVLEARLVGARIILNLNLNCSPEEMSSWGEQLSCSGIAMVTIQCSSGLQSIQAFMNSLKENKKCFSDDYQPDKESFSPPRPLALGVTLPDYMEQVVATPIFGNIIQCSRVLNGYAQNHLDGIVCSPNNLKSYHNSDFDKTLKLVTDVAPKGFSLNIQKKTISPIEAIEQGADYLLIREPIVFPPPGYSAKSEVERMLVEIIQAIQTKERLKRIPSTKSTPYITRKKNTVATQQKTC